MIRRRALEDWAAGHGGQDLQAFLAAKGYRQHEVELRRSWNAAMVPRRLPDPSLKDNSARLQPQHCDRGEEAGRPKRPNYLLRLKAFALGE